MTQLPPSSRTLVTLVLGLVLALTSPVGAQDAAPSETFGEIIDVRVVNLEVVVEKDGERLYGLKPEDFVLRVDGAEVPIEYFTEVLGGRAVASPEDRGGTVPALAPGEPVETSYLVFVDDYFTVARDRDRVLDNLIEQLPSLQPDDRMAVVAFDGRSLEMLSTWTQSPRVMEQALQDAQRRDAYGLQRRAERRIFETSNTFADRGFGPRARIDAFGLNIEEEQYALQLSDQVRSAAMAATSALRGFADPPGRKVMLLLSGGWPYDPSNWVVGDGQRTARALREMRSERAIEAFAETANRLSYTVYPIDVPGLDSVVADVSDATLEASNRRRAQTQQREFEEEAALRSIAAATGGRAFLDGSRLKALSGAADDTRSYYWLGFTPSWRGDDSAHQVDVDVRIPGAKVRSRAGFSDLSRSTEVTMMVESVLLFGGAPSGVPLDVQVERGKRSGWGKRTVPLEVRIPADELTYLPTQDGYVADLELRVAVIDTSGDTAEIPVIPMQMRMSREPAEGEFALYETEMKMRKDRHDLVVSIYDRLSGKILSSKVEVPAL
ncbi:MAG: VWA domain-containing protein [Acidobacteriota bacterium]